jgi:hypothetical protein
VKAGAGFNPYHCKYHVQFKSRHGSAWKGTYTADHLRPYRAATRALLKRPALALEVRRTLNDLDRLMQDAGRFESVAAARYLFPEKKARAVLARMRRQEVPAERLLVNHLAVTAAVREDPIGPGGEYDEYRLTQIAKACLRLASGYHSDPGEAGGYALYPRSAGRMLRILGGLIDRECRPFTVEYLDAILELKGQREANA